MEAMGADTAALVREALEKDALPVEKKTKSGVKEVDICPHLQRLSVEKQGERCLVKVTLPCGSSLSINPSLLAQAVTMACGPPAGEDRQNGAPALLQHADAALCIETKKST